MWDTKLYFNSQVEAEMLRLEQLKSSKIKEVLMKKRLELDEIYRQAHIVIKAHGATEYSFQAIASGKTSI